GYHLTVHGHYAGLLRLALHLGCCPLSQRERKLARHEKEAPGMARPGDIRIVPRFVFGAYPPEPGIGGESPGEGFGQNSREPARQAGTETHLHLGARRMPAWDRENRLHGETRRLECCPQSEMTEVKERVVVERLQKSDCAN